MGVHSVPSSSTWWGMKIYQQGIPGSSVRLGHRLWGLRGRHGQKWDNFCPELSSIILPPMCTDNLNCRKPDFIIQKKIYLMVIYLVCFLLLVKLWNNTLCISLHCVRLIICRFYQHETPWRRPSFLIKSTFIEALLSKTIVYWSVYCRILIFSLSPLFFPSSSQKPSFILILLWDFLLYLLLKSSSSSVLKGPCPFNIQNNICVRHLILWLPSTPHRLCRRACCRKGRKEISLVQILTLSLTSYVTFDRVVRFLELPLL